MQFRLIVSQSKIGLIREIAKNFNIKTRVYGTGWDEDLRRVYFKVDADYTDQMLNALLELSKTGAMKHKDISREWIVKIYDMNQWGKFKGERDLDVDEYDYLDNSGHGIELKHKKSGKEVFLAKKEFYDFGLTEYKGDHEILKTLYSTIYIKDETYLKIMSRFRGE
ncbi:MAG: hypothetical protein WCQ65_12040 [Fermentimonas sp.]|jgi:hypothetical protein